MPHLRIGVTLRIDPELYQAYERREEIEVMAPLSLNLLPNDEIGCGTEPQPSSSRSDARVISCGEIVGDYQKVRIRKFVSTITHAPRFTSPSLWAQNEP